VIFEPLEPVANYSPTSQAAALAELNRVAAAQARIIRDREAGVTIPLVLLDEDEDEGNGNGNGNGSAGGFLTEEAIPGIPNWIALAGGYFLFAGGYIGGARGQRRRARRATV